jgi:hypothetical protein
MRKIVAKFSGVRIKPNKCSRLVELDFAHWDEILRLGHLDQAGPYRAHIAVQKQRKSTG